MKLKTLFKAGVVLPLVTSIAGGVLLVSALSAEAAVTPTVTVVVQNGSNNNISSALIGTPVHANVLVASSTATTSPLGTVDFSLYPNTACTGSATVQSGVNLSNGSANSGTTTLTASGLSFKAHYNGQTDQYTTADSNCVSLSANQQNPTISNSLSATTIVVGGTVFDTASLNGALANASGTVSYRVFTDNACTANMITAGTKNVTNGSVPNSDSIQFNTQGTYYWQAVYSGDTNNLPATTTCGSAVLTVNATSTPPTGTPGTISGTVYNDQNKNDQKDSSDPGLSGWTVWLHKVNTGNNWWGKLWNSHDAYNDPIVATAVTDSNGNYSFGNLGAGNYFVEEKVMDGWSQTGDDVKVIISDSNTGKVVNFANIAKNGNSDNHHGHDGGDNDNEHGNKGDNGNHWGWFKNWGKKGNK